MARAMFRIRDILEIIRRALQVDFDDGLINEEVSLSESFYSEENIQKIVELAKSSTQPFYVYSLRQISERCHELKAALPNDVEVFYSLKANSHAKILETIQKSGLSADVASAGELQAAIDAGFAGAKIEFTGPGKTSEELMKAVKADVHSLIVESAEELLKIDEIAEKFGKKFRVHVRVNPKSKINSAGRTIQDEPSQFGVDEENGAEFARATKACRHVTVVGMHIHSQSQILSIEHALQNVVFALKAAENFSEAMPAARAFVNLGGGVGIPYSTDQAPIDIETYGRKIGSTLTAAKLTAAFSQSKFRLEFGRLISGEAGAFVTRVLYKKVSRGKEYAITDGGFTQSQIAVGVGQLIKRNLPIRVLPNEKRETKRISIAGPSCYGIDILANDVELPKVEAGDLIVVGNVGAYGYSFSPVHFLRQQLANEFFI